MFTVQQYQNLSDAQKEAVRQVAVGINGDDAGKWNFDSFDDAAFADHLGLAANTDGCVPEDYINDGDVQSAIIRKFKSIYGAALGMAKRQNPLFVSLQKAYCYVEPNYMDDSHVAIHNGNKVFYSIDQKAWALGFDTLEDLADEVLAVQRMIEERATP